MCPQSDVKAAEPLIEDTQFEAAEPFIEETPCEAAEPLIEETTFNDNLWSTM